eukprot:gene22037-29100_t
MTRNTQKTRVSRSKAPKPAPKPAKKQHKLNPKPASKSAPKPAPKPGDSLPSRSTTAGSKRTRGSDETPTPVVSKLLQQMAILQGQVAQLKAKQDAKRPRSDMDGPHGNNPPSSPDAKAPSPPKDRLDSLAAKHSADAIRKRKQLNVKRPLCENDTAFTAFQEMMQKHLPPAGSDNMVMVCGPPPMMNSISGSKAKDFSQGEVDGLLKDLGFDASMVYKF